MIKEMMIEQLEGWKSLGSPSPLLEYVLDKGEEFQNVITADRLGERKMCYMNAYNFVLDNSEYDYVEGYMLLEGIPLLIEHAWVVNKKTGQPVEVTTPNKAVGYFGVRYSRKEMIRWVLKTGYYGIHFVGELYNAEILKEYLDRARNFRKAASS